MSEEKPSWEEILATEPQLIGVNREIIERIINRAIEEERKKWKKEILKLKKEIDRLEQIIENDDNYIREMTLG